MFDFSSERNTGRQGAVDVLKAYAALWLIFCHAVVSFHWTDTLLPGFSGPYFTPYEFACQCGLCFVGAQSLMVCMGVGMAFSRRQDAGHYFRRGVSLVLLNTLLMFLRAGLPALVFGSHSFWSPADGPWVLSLMTCDIFLFAGLAFLFFGLAKKLRLSLGGIGVCALVFFALGEILSPRLQGAALSPVVRQLAHWFVYLPGEEGFSFLSWMVYPVLGLCLGRALRHCTDTNRFHLLLAGSGAALFAALRLAWPGVFHLGSAQPCEMAVRYYDGVPHIVLLYVALQCVWFGAAHFVAAALRGTRLWNAVLAGSRLMTPMYFASWVLFGWANAVLFSRGIVFPRRAGAYFAVSVATVVLSAALAVLFGRLTTRRAATRPRS